jgi:acyl-CoA synthetase (NDP forming)
MSVPRSLKGRFSAERLFAPESIVVCGADTKEGALVLANARAGGFKGRIMVVGGSFPDSYASIADLPEAPDLGLNASVCHIPVPVGRVALLTQSASLARAVVDWAGPNGVGFSHISGIGGNVDLGFAVGLDWLSRDPDTRLILLDIRRVRARRAFISAARAASRLRPVVAIRPGGQLRRCGVRGGVEPRRRVRGEAPG